eukprot:CAMPEP_0115002136 /NCGR_PEP_ID=MMETSP0216-20121206/17822_1 /TAXON_ID=223996 /ORGANISM="Protocruzia adherens, Strain Boccale" /LENGTH=182 /DNA_ID=CAMNT_0002367665 /DNA_START=122 /DNA_END=667 /DNA_ORIENTATION=-
MVATFFVLFPFILFPLILPSVGAVNYQSFDLFTFQHPSELFEFDYLAYSDVTDNVLISGSRFSDPAFIAASFSTWSAAGLNAAGTTNFKISPTGYNNCESLNGGFLTNASYKDFYYLVWTCGSPTKKNTTYLFAAKMTGDATVSKQAVFKLEETSVNTLVGFLDTMIIVPTVLGLVALDGDL